MLEAQAQYDFTARSSREVSFKKGDTIILFAQVYYIKHLTKVSNLGDVNYEY